jgi:hypothetical protein
VGLNLFLRRAEERARLAQQVAKIALETGGEFPQPQAKLPGDERALRGIPVAGFGGAIAGTRPEIEVVRSDERLRRRADLA